MYLGAIYVLTEFIKLQNLGSEQPLLHYQQFRVVYVKQA